ncbi:MAG: protein-glutamate O-methyltransferase CheR [Nitrospiraceae bacterium]|nr:protein-glutamate O-methyltransferase CheR [Nitrospiraceae bacterium]
MDIVLQETTFRQLRDFIYEKCGIFIPDMKKYIVEKKLAGRLQAKNLRSFEDYFYLLQYGGNGDEIAGLYDAITTNETSFFREPNQFSVLAEHVIPELLKSKKTGDLRFWSGACSTGEEPYTLAILLMEKKLLARASVMGSDISNEVLTAAQRGIYGPYSLRNMPEQYLKKYFKPNSGQVFEIDDSIRKSVRFMNVNLMDSRKTRLVSSADVIFCRNVLIYFDNKAKQKAISNLYDSLRPGGFLFIGTSESLHDVTRAFKPVIINKTIVYQRV